MGATKSQNFETILLIISVFCSHILKRQRNDFCLTSLYEMGGPVKWFVVANQREAKIFVEIPQDGKLKILKTLTNPLGFEKKRGLIRKEAGRGVKSIGRASSVHYTERKRHDPHEEAVIQFAKELCQFLQSEKLKNSFESMAVVAEPHFIGIIKAEMKVSLKKSVTNWIKKDLLKMPQEKLNSILYSPTKDNPH
jgi:protein required for attachment to host cells